MTMDKGEEERERGGKGKSGCCSWRAGGGLSRPSKGCGGLWGFVLSARIFNQERERGGEGSVAKNRSWILIVFFF